MLGWTDICISSNRKRTWEYTSHIVGQAWEFSQITEVTWIHHIRDHECLFKWHVSIMAYTLRCKPQCFRVLIILFPSMFTPQNNQWFDQIHRKPSQSPFRTDQPLMSGQGQPAYYIVYSHDNTSFLFPVSFLLAVDCALSGAITCAKACNHTWLIHSTDQRVLSLPNRIQPKHLIV